MSTLEELLKPLTRSEVEAYIYTAIKAKGTSHTAWKPGSFTRTMVTIVAILIAALSTLQVALAESAFLRYAKGVWLTLLARWVYGVERDAATFATGTVTLVNTGGGVYNNVPVGSLIVSNSQGFKYRNTAMFSLAALGTVNVPVSAVVEGSGSNSDPGDVSTIEAPTLTAVTVTNAAAIVGFDEQSDESLREECLASLGSHSQMGPSDAYEFAARNAKLSNGDPANVNRVKVLPPDGTGVVKVLVASSSGATPGAIGNLGTPLGAAHDAMMRRAAPLCVDVETEAAEAYAFSVLFDLTMPLSDGRSKAELQALLTTAVTAATPTVPIGGWNGELPNLWLVDLLKKTLPNSIRSSLKGDIKVGANQIPIPTVLINKLKTHAS